VGAKRAEGGRDVEMERSWRGKSRRGEGDKRWEKCKRKKAKEGHH